MELNHHSRLISIDCFASFFHLKPKKNLLTPLKISLLFLLSNNQDYGGLFQVKFFIFLKIYTKNPIFLLFGSYIQENHHLNPIARRFFRIDYLLNF